MEGSCATEPAHSALHSPEHEVTILGRRMCLAVHGSHACLLASVQSVSLAAHPTAAACPSWASTGHGGPGASSPCCLGLPGFSSPFFESVLVSWGFYV